MVEKKWYEMILRKECDGMKWSDNDFIYNFIFEKYFGLKFKNLLINIWEPNKNLFALIFVLWIVLK